MVIAALIPCVLLVGLGLVLTKGAQAILKIELDWKEQLIIALTAGSGLLIIPWAFIGIQGEQELFKTWPVVMGLIGGVGLVVVLYKDIRVVLGKLGGGKEQEMVTKEKSRARVMLIVVIAFLIGDLLFYQLLLPLRGYDAVWMYLPDALWYYQMDYIPMFNILNFRPSVKEPANTLLFTFALYTTQELSVELIPVLFMVVWGLVGYTWVYQISKDQVKALFTMALFLVSPFTNWMINFFPYYQDIYVGFYFTVAMYFTYKLGYQELGTREEVLYTVLAGVAVALALLAKLSGWTLLFVMVVAFPLVGKRKLVQLVVLWGVGLFLALKATTTVYWGMGVVVLVITGMLTWLVRENRTESRARLWVLVGSLGMGVGVGGYWLVDTFSRFPKAGDRLVDQYFSYAFDVVMNFRTIRYGELSYGFENAQQASFWGVVLFLLVGNVFVLVWAIPKIVGLMDKESTYFAVWVMAFYVVWLVYHGSVSFRYVTPIHLPVIIVVVNGFYKIGEKIGGMTGKTPIIFLGAMMVGALTSYYFPVGPGTILRLLEEPSLNVFISRENFLESASFYYSNALVMLGLITAVLYGLYKAYPWLSERVVVPRVWMTVRREQAIVGLGLLALVVVGPVLAPMMVLGAIGGDMEEFKAAWVNDERKAFQEVVDWFILENSPKSAILSVGTPDLALELNQPVLDLFHDNELTLPFYSENVTEVLYALINPMEYVPEEEIGEVVPEGFDLGFPSFDYVVVPNVENGVYEKYIERFYIKSPIFPLLNNSELFRLGFRNYEYRVFERIYKNTEILGLEMKEALPSV